MEPHVIVVGDPGTGKSTMLNALYGAAKFRSGITNGEGLTQGLQTECINGVRYSDTPGLDDVTHKQQAAEAIANAIKLGGAVKMLFVLTLEAGRIRASNLTTIRIVLSAFAKKEIDVSGKCSVIINKMSPRAMKMWGDPETNGCEVLRRELNLAYEVDMMAYLPQMAVLDDKDNGEMDASARKLVVDFLAKMKDIQVQKGTVIEVDVDQAAVLTPQFVAELEHLRRRYKLIKKVASGTVAALSTAAGAAAGYLL